MIDPNFPVTLKKHALFNGNFYHPREYLPGELPAVLLTQDYVSQGEVNAIPSFSPFTGAFEETTITIGPESPNNEISAYENPTVIVVHPRIQVNDATIEVIASLPGINLIVARKVVEERVKSPFISLEDLKARVTLSKTLKWEAFADKLLFDNGQIVEDIVYLKEQNASEL